MDLRPCQVPAEYLGTGLQIERPSRTPYVRADSCGVQALGTPQTCKPCLDRGVQQTFRLAAIEREEVTQGLKPDAPQPRILRG